MHTVHSRRDGHDVESAAAAAAASASMVDDLKPYVYDLRSWFFAKRRPVDPRVLLHVSSYFVPCMIVLCLLWTWMAAITLYASFVTSVLVLIDTVYLFGHNASNIMIFPEAFFVVPLGVFVMHCILSLSCAVRGDFENTNVGEAFVFSLMITIMYVVGSFMGEWVHALTPAHFVIALVLSLGLSIAPTLSAFGEL